MNLVWFLTIIAMIAGVMGEFGQFPFGSTTSVSLLDLVSLGCVMMLLIWQVGIKRQIYFSKYFWWLVGFEMCGLIGSLVIQEWSGLLYLLRFGVYVMWAWVGYSLGKSKFTLMSDWYKLIGLFGIGALLGGLGQMVVSPDMQRLSEFGFDPHNYRMSGLFLDPNFFGIVMAICTVVAVSRFLDKKRKGWLGLGVIFGFAVVLSFSRSAYLSLGVMMVGLSMWRSRRLLVILVVTLVLLIAIPRVQSRVVGGLVGDVSARERIESWQKGVEIWQSSPIVGVGFDNIRSVGQKMNLTKVYSADGGNSGAGVDSSLIMVLATTGAVGLVLFGGFWVSVFRKAWRSERLMVILFVGLLVDSWFINSLFWPIVMMWMYFSSGMVLAKD